MSDDDKSHLNFEQRVAGLSTKAGNIADKVEELVDWNGTWTPPVEGPESDTVEVELTTKETEAIARACRQKARSHYSRRGYCPSYCKYKYLYKKFSGRELTWHEDDAKYLKFKRQWEKERRDQ